MNLKDNLKVLTKRNNKSDHNRFKKHGSLLLTICFCALVLGFVSGCAENNQVVMSDTPVQQQKDGTAQNTDERNVQSQADQRETKNTIQADITAGDIVPFGGLDWIVLDRIDDYAYLLSTKAIAVMKHLENTDALDWTWESSAIRHYLNGEFYHSFSDEEKSMIVENDGTLWGDESIENPCIDMVSLLTLNDYNYFGSKDIAECTFDGELVKWSCKNVSNSGRYSFNLLFQCAPYEAVGVRPTIIIKLNESSFVPGNSITFGDYRWNILDMEDNKALIRLRTPLCEMQYAEVVSEKHEGFTVHRVASNQWEYSLVRRYLNNDFYNSFSPEDRDRILLANITNEGNLRFGTTGGNDTEDYFFLLSTAEYNEYRDKIHPYDYKPNEDSIISFSRSVGEGNDHVLCDGDDDAGIDLVLGEEVSIIPTAWISLS